MGELSVTCNNIQTDACSVFCRPIASENDFLGRSFVSANEQGARAVPPSNGEYFICCDRARFSAHQYPVNILDAKEFGFGVAACKHNILFTMSLIISCQDVKKTPNKIAGLH